MKLPLSLLVATALLFAAPVYGADRGFYIGAGVGQMNTQVDDIWDSGYDFDENDFGFKLFGGYKFFPWLSVEGAYVDGGSPEVKESNEFGERASLAVEVQSLVAAALFTLQVGEQVELFLKPGIAYWESESTAKFSDPVVSYRFSDDDSGSAFFLGAGVGYDFTENLGARLEFEWFEVAPEWDDEEEEFVDEMDGSAGFLSVSFLYRF